MEERQRKIDEWRASLAHLNLQMHLGLEEAKDEFEKQKKSLKEWTRDVQEKLIHTKDLTEEKAAKLKAGFEELQLQAALGKAETEDALSEQRDKLTKQIHDVKHKVHETYNHSKGKTKEVLGTAKDHLDDLHTRFDLFRLQAHLAKMETEEAWEERKKDLSQRMHSIKLKLEDDKNVASDRWDHFKEEMSEAWSHFRDAFKM